MSKYYIVCKSFLLISTLAADPVARDTLTTYYSISPTAFVAGRNDHAWERTGTSLWALASPQAMYAPVYLPDSAEVLEFTVWVLDNYTPNGMIIDLYRSLLNSAGTGTMAQVYSTPDGGAQELIDTTISNSTIDNENYMYYVQAIFYAPDTSHTLYGIKITYETYSGSPFVEEHKTPEQIPGVVPKVYPVPFSQNAIIEYSVPKQDAVSIKIYDQAGRIVRTLIDNVIPQGQYTARWDGKDMNGLQVAAGSYFCVIKTNGSSTTKILYIN